MPSREEIRKGILTDISWMANQHIDIEGVVDGILLYLHNSGVVIKVDRELPKNLYMGTTDTLAVNDRWHIEGYVFAQQDMLKAGYVAVEPLI